MLAVKKMSESHWMILLVLRNENSGTSPIKEHKVPQISFQEVFLAGYESSWIHLEVGYLCPEKMCPRDNIPRDNVAW